MARRTILLAALALLAACKSSDQIGAERALREAGNDSSCLADAQWSAATMTGTFSTGSPFSGYSFIRLDRPIAKGTDLEQALYGPILTGSARRLLHGSWARLEEAYRKAGSPRGQHSQAATILGVEETLFSAEQGFVRGEAKGWIAEKTSCQISDGGGDPRFIIDTFTPAFPVEGQ